MPVHFSFTFGVGSYFQFSFGIGSPTPKKATTSIMEAAVTTTNTAVAEPATKLSVIARKKRKIKPSLVAATERTNRADKDAQETLLCVKNALGPELFKSLSSLKARNSPSPKVRCVWEKSYNFDLHSQLSDGSNLF